MDESSSVSPSPPLQVAPSSSAPHTIRLRGPWDCQPLARATLLPDGSLSSNDRDLPHGAALLMPADWSAAVGAEFRGRVRFTRRFAQPTGLNKHSRVWLAIKNVDWQARLVLNGHELGLIQLAGTPPAPLLFAAPSPSLPLSPSPSPSLTICPARFNITTLLLPRNELTIDVLLPEFAEGTAPLPRGQRAAEPGGLIGLVSLEIEEVEGR